jgi:hypothetical protein
MVRSLGEREDGNWTDEDDANGIDARKHTIGATTRATVKNTRERQS